MENNSTIPQLNQSHKIKTPLLLEIVAILFSGVCWYLSCGLNGDFWFLLWVAPVPVLAISLRVTSGSAFVLAFIAFLIGRLSWVPYLLSVVPVFIAVLFTLILPLIFSLVLLLARRIVLHSGKWISVFAFPSFWVLVEWLNSLFSRDGTIASLAYTQINFLPLVQLASVAGIIGISFFVTFVPSAIAVGWYLRKNRSEFRRLIVFSICITIISLGYGIIRLNHNNRADSVHAGLLVADKNLYRDVYDANTENEIKIARSHIILVHGLALQGAKLIVLAEKAIPINDSAGELIINMFREAALQNKVGIIIGCTRLKKGFDENTALVISPEGNIICEYKKVNLFEGEAIEGFQPGTEPGNFKMDSTQYGVAICKDLDFDHYIRKYNKENIQMMFVPAWDFVRDGWLHSRMAVMRGVENGYAIIRVAQEGNLTISDDRGRILAEAVSEKGKDVSLTALAPLGNTPTLFKKLGDWFAYLNVALSIFLISRYWKKRQNKNPQH